MTDSEEELKTLLMKVKEKSEKTALKVNIQKTKIMASGPITSQQIDGENMETVTDFIFLAPKSLWTVTAAMKLKDACSLVGGKKTKQNTLASWKKSYDQHRQRIKRKRHHFAYKGLYSQSYGFFQ